jgi:hypothetical protein
MRILIAILMVLSLGILAGCNSGGEVSEQSVKEWQKSDSDRKGETKVEEEAR